MEGLARYKEAFGNFFQAEEDKTVLVNQINTDYTQLTDRIKKGQLWTEQMVAAASVFMSSINSYFAKNSDGNWSNLVNSIAGLKKSIDEI